MLEERDARKFSPLEHELISQVFDATPTPEGESDFKSFILMCERAPQHVEILGLPFTVFINRGATTKRPEERERYYMVWPGTPEVRDPVWMVIIGVDHYTGTSTERPVWGYLLGDVDQFMSAMTLLRTVKG